MSTTTHTTLHLHGEYMTAAHRRGFAALIDAGMEAGKVGRTVYRITLDADGWYTGTATFKERQWNGALTEQTNRYRFTT